MMVCRMVSRSSVEVKALATSWKILNSYDCRCWSCAGVDMRKPDGCGCLQLAKSEPNSRLSPDKDHVDCAFFGVSSILTAFLSRAAQKDYRESSCLPSLTPRPPLLMIRPSGR